MLEHIDSWIGKEFIELLSNIYVYMPLIITSLIVIIRNNSIKSSLLLTVIIIGLIVLVAYTLVPLKILFADIVEIQSLSRVLAIVVSINTFSICLFRSRFFSIVLVILVGLILLTLSGLFLLHLFEFIVGIVESLVFYSIYKLVSKKLSLSDNTWISQQYTRSGYALADIQLLSNMMIITGFIILIALLYRIFIY